MTERATLPITRMKEQFNVFNGRTVLAALGATAVAGGLSFAAIPANAAPVYSDTSVQIFDNVGNRIPLQSVDAITDVPVTAQYTKLGGGSATVDLNSAPTVVPAFTAASVTYSGTGIGLAGPLKYSIVNTVNLPSSVALSLDNAGTLTLDPTIDTAHHCPGVAVDNANNISVTVKVTDGTAVGFETLTAVPLVVENPGGTCPGGKYITQITVTASTDTVNFSGTNDNTTGRVFFNPSAGLTFTSLNLPKGTGGNPGVTLAGDVLSATSTVPGVYNDIAVTATDTMGATATDTFDVYVKGAVMANDTPRLSHGHAVELNPVRENVYFTQDGSASCDHFTIVGPGQINGHEGWVPAHLGLNVAVYGGLEAHHGYTVYYQPVSGPADCSTHSTDLWPGAHWGYVYFVS